MMVYGPSMIIWTVYDHVWPCKIVCMVRPPAFVPPPDHASRYPPKLQVFVYPTSSGRLLAAVRDAWQRRTQCGCRLHVVLTSLGCRLRAACLQLACSLRAACRQPARSLHTAYTQLVCNRHGKHTDPTHVASIMQHSRYNKFL